MQSIKTRGYQNLKGLPLEPPDPQDLMRLLVRQGDLLLAAEEAEKNKTSSTSSKALEDSLAAKSKNPYVRARVQVLAKLPAELRKRVEQMETTKDVKNPIYERFTKAIALLGDKLSEEKN